MINYKILVISLLILFGKSCEVKKESSEKPLTLDENIRYGKLNNGFEYYIKEMDQPQNAVKMHFIVKVGNDYEASNEQDFAHTIEHLAFRETKHFPQSVNSEELLEELGMLRDFGGYTTRKSTGYRWNAPDVPEAIEAGFLWFRDIATELVITKGSVARERNVILQESAPDAVSEQTRTRKLLYEKMFPCKYRVEGSVEHIKTFPHDHLQQFYKKWYRPDRMAVVIIGNIEDVGEMERTIERKFSDIGLPTQASDSPDCDQQYFDSPPQFSVVETQKDQPMTMNLFFRDPIGQADLGSWSGIRKLILNELIVSILSNRLQEQAKILGSSTFMTANFTHNLKNSPNAIRVIINAKDEERKALKETVAILNQLKRHGVTVNELKRAKEKFLKAQKDPQTDGSYWDKEIAKHYVYGEALPVQKGNSLQTWVSMLPVEDINHAINRVVSQMPDDIGIILPAGYMTPLKSERKIREMIIAGFKEMVEPYVGPAVPESLMNLGEKQLLKERGFTEIETQQQGVWQYELENGVNLILKPTSLPEKNKKIMVHGFSSKGASCFPKEEFFSTIYAPQFLGQSGVGDLNKLDLQRFLSHSNSLKMGVTPYIRYSESGIKGSAAFEEVEDLLQLIYLYFSEPRKDIAVFNKWKSGSIEYAMFDSPRNHLYDMQKEMTKDYSYLPRTSEKIKVIEDIDLEQAFMNYKKLFGSADDFTFVFTGSFDAFSILSIANKYLGNISSSSSSRCSQEIWSIDSLPEGPVYKIVEPLTGPLSDAYFTLKYVRPKTEGDDWKEEIKVKALGILTNFRVRELRTEGYGLYFFGVGGSLNQMMNRYEITFSFSLVPQEQADIRRRSKEIVGELKSGKISKAVLEMTKSKLLKRYSPQYLSGAKKTGEDWYEYIRYNEPLIDSTVVIDFIKSLTIEDYVETAKKQYQEEFLYEFLMQ